MLVSTYGSCCHAAKGSVNEVATIYWIHQCGLELHFHLRRRSESLKQIQTDVLHELFQSEISEVVILAS